MSTGIAENLEDQVSLLFFDSPLHDEVEKFCKNHRVENVLNKYWDAVCAYVQANSTFNHENSLEIAETLIREVFDCSEDE